MSSSIPYVPLIPANDQVRVPKVISDWKYSKSVQIDNIGCPTQINVVLDQDGCDVAPLLYVRLRCGSCTVYFCPTGQLVRGDPILYDTTCANEVLTTVAAFKLFEIIVPLARMAMALHQSGVALPGVLNAQYSFPTMFEKRQHNDVDEQVSQETETDDALTKSACREAVVVK